MTEQDLTFVVDRIEGDLLILVSDADAASRSVPRSELPHGFEEGTVVRVPLDVDGQPRWSAAVADEALREERLEKMRERLDRLKGRDPGGDVTL